MKNMISVFKALSDRNRLRIVAALTTHDELCACQLTEMLKVSGATASRHLGVLLGCGLLDSRKDGRWVYYRLLADDSEWMDFAPVLAWLRAEFDKSEDIVFDRQRLRAITLCGPEEFCRKHRGDKERKKRGRGSMDKKLKILFLCTGNSCRSQMAEGWARHLKGEVIEAYSAGIEIHGLNPLAVKVMAEAGVDISGHRSQHIDECADVAFDAVVTICGHAHEHCPYFPGSCKVIHAGFNDPPQMAKELADRGGTEEEQLDCYRRVRDEIRDFVETLPEVLNV